MTERLGTPYSTPTVAILLPRSDPGDPCVLEGEEWRPLAEGDRYHVPGTRPGLYSSKLAPGAASHLATFSDIGLLQ